MWQHQVMTATHASIKTATIHCKHEACLNV